MTKFDLTYVRVGGETKPPMPLDLWLEELAIQLCPPLDGTDFRMSPELAESIGQQAKAYATGLRVYMQGLHDGAAMQKRGEEA